MAAPVKPDPAPPAGTPIPSSAATPSPPTPPTNQPATPPTNGGPGGSGTVSREEFDRAQRIIEAQERVIQDNARNSAEITQRLREIDSRIKVVETPEPDLNAQNAEFWRNPVGVIREMVKGEMAATVAPINERLRAGDTISVADREKAKMKIEYGPAWDRMEPFVDQFVKDASARGVEVDANLMNVAALAAVGIVVKRDGAAVFTPAAPAPAPPNGQPPSPPAPAPAPSMISPPHLRPSAPAIPGAEPDKPQIREFSENEKRLMRERGQTPEQYLAWLDIPPEGVASSRIGKPEAPKK